MLGILLRNPLVAVHSTVLVGVTGGSTLETQFRMIGFPLDSCASRMFCFQIRLVLIVNLVLEQHVYFHMSGL